MQEGLVSAAPTSIVREPALKRPSPEDWEVFRALQELGDPPQDISPNWAIYNTVSIPGISGTIFLSRAVDRRNIREGEPDRNSIQVCVADSRGKRQRLPDLDLPVDDEIVNWEDPRVGTDGTLGFTVVTREGHSYNPHPALVRVETEDGHVKVAGTPKIFKNITGKNVIPLEDGFLYRPDRVSHQLQYLDPQGELLKIIDFSNFRNIEWLSKKMGVAARPIELKDGLKLLFIHGVRGGRGIDGRPKDDIYAIGIAVLDQSWRVVAVDKKPILERKDFLRNLPTDQDLRPEKEVVYLCDFTERKDGLILPTTVGDRITVFTPISYSQLHARINSSCGARIRT